MDDIDPGHARRPGTTAGFADLARVLVVRLGPGEDVLPALEQVLHDARITDGVIVSAVASLQRASIRNIHRFPDVFPITSGDRKTTTVPGPLEILAMQGNVHTREDGELVIHAHLEFSLGTPAGVTYGGHLIEDTIVGTTCELYIAELTGLDVRRRLDPNTQAYEVAVDPPQR